MTGREFDRGWFGVQARRLGASLTMLRKHNPQSAKEEALTLGQGQAGRR